MTHEDELDAAERRSDRIGNAVAVALLVILLGAIMVVGIAGPNLWL